jgi:cellobiose-specific phosphotransferase system component IIB
MTIFLEKITNYYNSTTMKNLILSLVAIFALTNVSLATCVFQKNLEGQEFQIGVMLTWVTQIEENTSTFIVERSENGIDYTNVGTVAAAGTSKKNKDYNFLDVLATTPYVYYRLKQVDLDGSFSFTDVYKLKKPIVNNFMVANMSSSAASKEFTAVIDAFQEGDMAYELRDLEGNVMFASVQPMVNGLNNIVINLADQKPNLYKLVFKFGKEEESIVIEKVLTEIEKKEGMATNPNKTGRH